MKLERPSETEYASFYSGYVSRVPEDDVLTVLQDQRAELRELASRVPPSRESFRYAPGKWSVREVFGHLADAERVFGYRAFCIGRGDGTPLPGFDEKAYIQASEYDRIPLSELAAEWARLRESNLFVLGRLAEPDWKRIGNANGSPVSERALAYVMAGHVRHHLGVLSERYEVK